MSETDFGPRFLPGLVSITFRQLGVADLIARARDAGLAGIEWGGDVHVPPGDLDLAARVGEKTRAAGLEVVTYGTYYRLQPDVPPPFADWLATARALGAPRLRVWVTREPSATASEAHWQTTIELAREAVAAATEAGISLLFEHHDRTLTDTTASARRVLDAVPGSKLGWQPPNGVPAAAAAADLAALLPRVETAHVFAWGRDHTEQVALSDHTGRWRRYLDLLAEAPVSPLWLLLEHLPGADPALLPREAATLHQWIAGDIAAG